MNQTYTDSRGSIEMILESCQIGSISEIVSFANNFRANHWHPNDTHIIEVLEGEVWLYERPVGSKDCPILKVVKKNELSFTDKQVEHTMYFPVYTVFRCYSKLPRNTENYEKETFRFEHNLKVIYDTCNRNP